MHAGIPTHVNVAHPGLKAITDCFPGGIYFKVCYGSVVREYWKEGGAIGCRELSHPGKQA